MFHLKLPKDILEKLRKIAKEQLKPISVLIRDAISDYLKKTENVRKGK